MPKLLRDNSLAIVAFGLFALFMGGQAITGYQVYLQDLQHQGVAGIGFSEYLLSGHFIEATFENWESEFLQMAALVLLSVRFFQKGSSESKDPDADEAVDRTPDPRRPGAPWPVRHGGIIAVIYKNSLALALLGLFAMSVFLHVIGGATEFNRLAQAQGEPTTTALGFLTTPDFWFQSMQNWQSEFLSVGVLVVLTIFLRQHGSPESKPVDESHSTTGES